MVMAYLVAVKTQVSKIPAVIYSRVCEASDACMVLVEESNKFAVVNIMTEFGILELFLSRRTVGINRSFREMHRQKFSLHCKD